MKAVIVLVATSVWCASAASIRGLSVDNRSLCDWLPFLCPWQKCPVVSPVDDFDLDKYIEKSWFVQMQQVNPYQAEDQLFCVTATYSKQEDSSYIKVQNYANQDEVNGSPVGTEGGFSDLCAKQKEEGTGELAVAPCLFTNLGLFDFIAGPYWVLAVDADYTWAIISGGQPTEVEQEDPVLCTTKEGDSFLDTNGSGLWLFTREKIADQATIDAMKNTLESLGVFTGNLKKVEQEGCLYEGATIKA
mmetsp:Transcript_9591/g.10927  ORF Transcript_9591/g.10927 Transcript_9591/m.10927 type:complete len:246 (-) Transcript_9591:61-798(-)|eukprot:CAMPEP_0184029434 /NCGR_PEP_ID=MMETSP0955-20130417/463_1 /TAXON_ID=627963 /ORGANISM="Aplanochytrium sp, Strain PBS07" /LENGTH=245 /DNA_ID=CAMNT_0026314497 /DNA_START=275 /DNA_END=1012 /DNA_ORIENTATION=+